MRKLAVIMVLFALAGCSAAPPPAPTVNTPTVNTPTATNSGPVRPGCAEPDEGRYREVSGSQAPVRILLLGVGSRGVAIGAQANGGICQTLAYARELVAAGYHVAVFDWAWPYAETMAYAARALHEEGAERVVLGGFSRGALVGLGIAPDLGPWVAGVFSVSGGPSEGEGFPTVASLSRFAGRILIVGSELDTVFPVGVQRALAAAHKGSETLLIVPGGGHALSLLDGDQGAAVRAAIIAFLGTALAR